MQATFRPSLFPTPFLGGFECSTQRRGDGRRLDLIAGTRHDLLAEEDYRQLTEHGIRAARDGVRWHLAETAPGQYDWSAVLPLLRAAESAGVQVVWDLCHYGWPDGLDVFSAAFVERFARYAAAFARLHLEVTGRPAMVCPVNEISFLAWAGGDMRRLNPCCEGRGGDLKRQLVRTALAGAAAVREATPGALVFAIDPIIHIVPKRGHDPKPVETYNGYQWEAWDMLVGQTAPELGGHPDAFDVLGVNYYWNNQWTDGAEPLSVFDSERFIPVHKLFAAAHARYGKRIFLAETSIEGDNRAGWLRYIAEEVREAIRHGVPMEGICLYPVLSHMGWDEDRYCPNGLFELEPKHGRRVVHAPLAAELRRQNRLFAEFFGDQAKEVAA
ncbi:beta-glucosidase [Paeniroseomonas aquatica]|uniref:Beta-glucosidase n=1 Tax=Paeniroseomonas aquatica TaxID=373043 RepID=A0ABT8A8W2_9PROT|nr:beta-glucosidase [Paeniroseomonas aquatica]MDN3566149.1 beta-glucosidase [Paeniroseomonas aquatica]